jgi:hypothetical protein
VDSNFRFRERYKRGLGRKSSLRLHAAVDYLRLPLVAITKAQSEISESNPYRARNGKFESISLQRGVRCELEASRRDHYDRSVSRSPMH